MGTIAAAAGAVFLVCSAAGAQTATDLSLRDAPADAKGPPAAIQEGAAPVWEVSLTGFGYIVPEDHDYFAATLTADYDRLHLEARYNYEALNTGSIFAGYNFKVGEELALEFTPMVGGVFGDINGVAPGYRLTLSYAGFELYTEGEYFIDTHDSTENFFYSWSELTYSPAEWVRFGLAAQRTHAYESDVDFQPGVLLGFSVKNVDVTLYLFDSGMSSPTVVIAVGVNF